MRKLLGSITLVMALLALPLGARANNITIGLQETGFPTVVISSPTDGFNSLAAGSTYGDFTFSTVSGAGLPLLVQPALLITSLNVSSANAGVLNVFITETGLSLPPGFNAFTSAFTSNTFTGGVTSVVEQTFINSTLLAGSTFSGLGSNSSTDGAPSLTGPYSVTVEYTITTTGSGNFNGTLDLSLGTVPEPSALLLSGFGLAGLLLFAKRRRA